MGIRGLFVLLAAAWGLPAAAQSPDATPALFDPDQQLAAASAAASNLDNVARFRRDACGTREEEFEMPRKQEKRDHIFVSIASYRDDACKRTVADLFAKAARPERITVGIVQQNQAGTAEDCIAGCPLCAEKQGRGQILVKSYDYTEARGPAFARWAASRLWDGSEFFLQIDAHTGFQPGWDQSIIEQYRATGDPMAVLTHYPPDERTLAEHLSNRQTIVNCSAEFAEDGIFRQRSMGRVDARAGAIASPFAAAGFLFMPGRVLYTVPYDPYLVFVFHPEEAIYSARLWTSGFNPYAPPVPIITHEYHHRREHGKVTPRYYESAKSLKGCTARALTRARFLLGMSPLSGVDPAFAASLGRYGMGRARSLKDYYAYAGLDVMRKTVIDKCRF